MSERAPLVPDELVVEDIESDSDLALQLAKPKVQDSSNSGFYDRFIPVLEQKKKF